ncbi:MAG TPA: alpha/beta hydrolase [Drouetiella sp.]
MKRRYVTIPVLYVTDRAPTKKGYGPQRKDEDLSSIDELRYGWFDYAVKTDTSVDSIQHKLGWTESEKSPQRDLTMGTQTDTASVQGFGETIIEAAKKAGTDQVFVMVHGFNTPFANAARNAALLEKAVKRPVILYSWPSKGRLGQYGVDLGNNEWSQEHFDSLIDELVRVKEKAGITFNLVAHSMGNRLAVHSAPVLKGRHVFQQMFLVDPDFDAETFVHYLYRYARKKDGTNDEATSSEKVKAIQAEATPMVGDAGDTTSDGTEFTNVRADDTKSSGVKPDASEDKKVEQTKVRILFSHKDRALPLSELIFGGYTRLGQAADSLLSSVSSPLSIPGKLGDALSAVGGKDVPKDSNHDAKKSSTKPQWMMKFEWIDFTALDHGLIGHTIPYDLIANLWSTNKPGAGLTLVPSHNGSVNRMSSIFSHLFGEKDHISSKIVTAQRVILSPKNSSKPDQD